MDLIAERIEQYNELLLAARGEIEVDMVVESGRILNVLTGEILPGNVAIHKGFIVALFMHEIQARQRIDARGKIILPAFIDPHVHIESSMVLPPAYSAVVAAHGTGTVFADPHEIVNVMGVEGFSLMADNTSKLPLRLYFDIPTCVPAKRGAEIAGADIQAEEVREMARRGGRKLGELMSYAEITAGEPVMTDIVKTGWRLGLPRDAHFPMIGALGGLVSRLSPPQMIAAALGMIGTQYLKLRFLSALPYAIMTKQLRKDEYRNLNAYLVALGLTADHETYGPEIQTKLDHGMRLMLSSHIFTLPQLMPVLLHAVKRLRYKDSIGLCTDDIWPDELLEKGGMAGVLRDLAKHGLNPVDGVRFATLNNAQRLAMAGIPEAALIGAIAPGMAADLALAAEPLGEFRIDLVIHAGEVVAEGGKLIRPIPDAAIPQAAMDSVHLAPVHEETFRIPVPDGAGEQTARVRVMSLPKPPALPFPELNEEDVPISNGYLETQGYTLIAAFHRHGKAAPGPAIGLIRGYSLREGAVASTMSHDSHNLVVLGTNPADMAAAVNRVLETKGGMTAVCNNQILASIAFPVGGLMTTGTVEEVAPQARAFRQAIGKLGLDPNSPILPFAIFSLPAAPGAKLTDRGLWDGEKASLAPLFV